MPITFWQMYTDPNFLVHRRALWRFGLGSHIKKAKGIKQIALSLDRIKISQKGLKPSSLLYLN